MVMLLNLHIMANWCSTTLNNDVIVPITSMLFDGQPVSLRQHSQQFIPGLRGGHRPLGQTIHSHGLGSAAAFETQNPMIPIWSHHHNAKTNGFLRLPRLYGFVHQWWPNQPLNGHFNQETNQPWGSIMDKPISKHQSWSFRHDLTHGF